MNYFCCIIAGANVQTFSLLSKLNVTRITKPNMSRTTLYPLKFRPILKERLWGGERLQSLYGKKYPDTGVRYGESWELSPVQGSMSVVTNGFLRGNTINELAEIYMGDLLGEKVFNEFGAEFPLLIKLIDAAETLSVQVHPGNSMAQELHGSNGKSEMWYVLHADKGAEIISGVKPHVTPEMFAEAMQSGQVLNFLETYQVVPHDFFFIPSGTVHAIGKGVVLLEIQQASDITYRIYDWDRVDASGKPRALHKDLALKAINFNENGNGKKSLPPLFNQPQQLVTSEYFTVNRLYLKGPKEVERNNSESFVIYFCIDGAFAIAYQDGEVKVGAGEIVLVPAEMELFLINPKVQAKIVEISI